MAHQQQVGRTARDLVDDRADRHRPEFGIQQFDVEAGIQQRPADAQQAERRQVLARDAAADGGVRRIEQEDAHATPGGRRSDAGAQAGSIACMRGRRCEREAGRKCGHRGETKPAALLRPVLVHQGSLPTSPAAELGEG